MGSKFLEKSRAGRVQSRMGRDLRLLMQFEPALAGIALWVTFHNVEDGEVAWTDGKRVCAGSRYEKLDEADRCGVVLHELYHVALGHPARMVRMRLADPHFDAKLANIAADAIINASIRVTTAAYVSRVRLPDWTISLADLLREHSLPFADVPEAQAVSKWSMESLYAALKASAAEAKDSHLTVGDDVRDDNGDPNASGAKDGEGNGDTEGDGSGARHGARPEPRRARAPGAHTDEVLRDEIEGWQKRLTSMWGSVPGLRETLIGDVPAVPTKWEPHLRSFLTRSIGKPGRANYSKPSRRYSALERGMWLEEGVRLPFEPGRDYPKKSARIGLAIDTSLSMTDEILKRVVGEVAAIMRQTNASILLLTADTDVTSSVELRGVDGERTLRNFSCKGRGGTNFAPALAAMRAWKPDVAVYLTDLEGPCGEKPLFPVMWAVIPGYDHAAAPFGRIVHLR